MPIARRQFLCTSAALALPAAAQLSASGWPKQSIRFVVPFAPGGTFETSQWYGILAPAGTPADIVRKLQEESLKALKSNSVTERFTADGATGGGGPSSEFAAYIAQQQKIWKEIVRRAGIKAD